MSFKVKMKHRNLLSSGGGGTAVILQQVLRVGLVAVDMKSMPSTP